MRVLLIITKLVKRAVTLKIELTRRSWFPSYKKPRRIINSWWQKGLYNDLR
jgi:predicted secreted protein